MAGAGDSDLNAKLTKTFKHFVQVSSVGKTLTEEQKKEITDKGMNKMLKECCGDKVAKCSEAQVFCALAGKTKKIKLDQFLGTFLTELAIVLVHNEMVKKDRTAKKPSIKDSTVVAKLEKIKEEIACKHDTQTKGVAVNKVTERLTDAAGYTGSHKERFDAKTGEGKGMAGRKDMADNSGYVTGYANKDTYKGNS